MRKDFVIAQEMIISGEKCLFFFLARKFMKRDWH